MGIRKARPHEADTTDQTAAADDRLYNEVRAAQRIDVSPRTLQKWRVTGDGPPFIQLSARCIRYRHADLMQWAQQHRRRSTSEYPPEGR